MDHGVLNRDVTLEECPWLPRELKQGDVVYSFIGCTYGCITPTGTAVSLTGPDESVFYELPSAAIDWNAPGS